jgi:general stress protein 26
MSDDIKTRMWKEMADHPYVMAAIEGGGQHSIPMNAVLDKDAHGAFWFYHTKDGRLAKGGRAMVQYVAKGHDLFACISGTLVTETDPAVIDRYWDNTVAAWYEGGRDDPNLLMLRFELDDAEIWTADGSIVGVFKLMTGMTMKGGELGEHAEVSLQNG